MTLHLTIYAGIKANGFFYWVSSPIMLPAAAQHLSASKEKDKEVV